MESDELEETLGAAVRRRRIAAGLTREHLADRANVSLGAVRNLETGAGATVRTLVRVTHALGATNWLEALAPHEPSFSPLAAMKEAERTRKSGPPRVRASRKGQS